MKKIINKTLKIFTNKYLAIIILILLLGFWLVGTFFLVNHVSFSVLTFRNNSDFSNEKILKGEKIGGEFIARQNNLGIILVPFREYAKPDFAKEDKLIFRIKEKNSTKWYYSSDYRSGLVNSGYFPFGFPQIIDSKNKIYRFELISQNGNPRNSLSVSKDEFISGYQLSKSEIFSNNKNLFNFFITKTLFSLSDSYLILSSLTFMLPLIVYLLIFLNRSKNKIIIRIIQVSFILLVFINMFVIKDLYLGLLGLNIILWIWIILKNKYDSKITFKLTFSILFIWLLIKFLNVNYPTQNINVLAFFFLVIGVIQAIIEEKR